MAYGSRESGGGFLGNRIGNALVSFGRGSVETLTNGVLSLVHRGKKQVLPSITDPLLLEPAVLLAQKIRRGQVSSVSVVKAYIERIDEVDSIINAVVERRFSEALRDATAADILARSGIKTEEQLARETPLLGVPFTSKEACLVKGLSSTSGLVCRKGMKAHEDCEAVSLLRKAGAIPIAVTNTSEICMWWETYNNLHGQTKNPYDTTRTVGGSSGGEAALIGAAGSLMGLGTDLGGSIRLPCFFTGIFGHKPSSGLVPHGGQFPPALHEIIPYVVTGPMARYAKDLRLLLKVLAGEEASTRLQLDQQVPFRSMKVYYMFDDGGQPVRSPVDPELKAGMQNVLDWLRETGVSIEEANVQNLKYGFMIWGSCLSKVKDQKITGLMSGDVKPSDVEPLREEMLKWFYGKSDYTFPVILNACLQDYIAPLLSIPLDVFYKRALELKKEMDELLRGDAVFLCPTFPTPAQHHGQMLFTPLNVGYSVVFNALGLPVTQCPLGLTMSGGLPIGMQIVAAHGNDRLTLSLVEEIEQKFFGWIRP